MKTKTITLYTLAELKTLSEDPESPVFMDAHSVALSTLSDRAIYGNWWDSVEVTINEDGFSLDSFDIYHREIHITKETVCYWDVARRLLKNWGHESPIYRLTHDYLVLATKQRREWLTIERQSYPMTTRYDWDESDEARELINDFLSDLKQEYLSLLTSEYEYLTSEEYITDFAEANDFYFDKYGNITSDES